MALAAMAMASLLRRISKRLIKYLCRVLLQRTNKKKNGTLTTGFVWSSSFGHSPRSSHSCGDDFVCKTFETTLQLQAEWFALEPALKFLSRGICPSAALTTWLLGLRISWHILICIIFLFHLIFAHLVHCKSAPKCLPSPPPRPPRASPEAEEVNAECPDEVSSQCLNQPQWPE